MFIVDCEGGMGYFLGVMNLTSDHSIPACQTWWWRPLHRIWAESVQI